MSECRVTMFSGKGGVGKTTCAALTGVHYAARGEPTLIISTDPTPSLSHIFKTRDGGKPARVAENLYLAELGLEEIKRMWDDKFGREVYEVFSTLVSIPYEEFTGFIASILPGLRDEFMVDYIKRLAQGNTYRHIIWDTAPLGQTLGLLQTPGMLSQHLKPAPRIYSRLKLGNDSRRSVLNIIRGWEQLSREDVEFLRSQVTFTLVTIPEALAVEQIDGIMAEFATLGLKFQRLIINNVIRDLSSPFLQAKSGLQQGYLETLHRRYNGMEIVELSLSAAEIRGLDALREVGRSMFKGAPEA